MVKLFKLWLHFERPQKLFFSPSCRKCQYHRKCSISLNFFWKKPFGDIEPPSVCKIRNSRLGDSRSRLNLFPMILLVKVVISDALIFQTWVKRTRISRPKDANLVVSHLQFIYFWKIEQMKNFAHTYSTNYSFPSFLLYKQFIKLFLSDQWSTIITYYVFHWDLS